MTEVVIRPEQPEDAAAVRAVLMQAFARPTEADLVERLRGYPDTRVMVAEADGEFAGCAAFSRATMAAGRASIALAALGPVAIEPFWQGQGVGTLLLEKGLEDCASRGCAAVVVLGHPDFYRRFGFAPARDRGLRCKWVVPEDAFMVKELRRGALAGTGGLVEYLPEFDDV